MGTRPPLTAPPAQVQQQPTPPPGPHTGGRSPARSWRGARGSQNGTPPVLSFPERHPASEPRPCSAVSAQAHQHLSQAPKGSAGSPSPRAAEAGPPGCVQSWLRVHVSKGCHNCACPHRPGGDRARRGAPWFSLSLQTSWGRQWPPSLCRAGALCREHVAACVLCRTARTWRSRKCMHTTFRPLKPLPRAWDKADPTPQVRWD